VVEQPHSRNSPAGLQVESSRSSVLSLRQEKAGQMSAICVAEARHPIVVFTKEDGSAIVFSRISTKHSTHCLESPFGTVSCYRTLATQVGLQTKPQRNEGKRVRTKIEAIRVNAECWRGRMSWACELSFVRCSGTEVWGHLGFRSLRWPNAQMKMAPSVFLVASGKRRARQ
jgi:hypothetical protein